MENCPQKQLIYLFRMVIFHSYAIHQGAAKTHMEFYHSNTALNESHGQSQIQRTIQTDWFSYVRIGIYIYLYTYHISHTHIYIYIHIHTIYHIYLNTVHVYIYIYTLLPPVLSWILHQLSAAHLNARPRCIVHVPRAFFHIFLGKLTIGKPQENSDLMGFNGIQWVNYNNPLT